MQEFEHTITDPDGIHARPAGLFAQRMQGFQSTVSICRGDQEADGKKLISLMKLRLKCGQNFTVRATGPDEAAVIEAAREFLAQNL
jgi:phosphotransferase system HPr (HPr) family protein